MYIYGKGIGCNLALIFFLLNLPFSQPMLLKPAVYFDGNQVEIMKLHKSSPYSKICLNLGALHPSSPANHLMNISTLWPDTTHGAEDIDYKMKVEKNTKNPQCPLVLLHNAD